MNEQACQLASVYSSDASYYYYQKSAQFVIYYGNSEYLYLVDGLYKPLAMKNEVFSDNSKYLEFRKLNIPGLNQYKLLKTLKIPQKNLVQINMKYVENVQSIKAESLKTADLEDATLLVYEENGKLQRYLLIGVDLEQELSRIQCLQAQGIACLNQQIQTFRGLKSEEFCMESESHQKYLELLLSSVESQLFSKLGINRGEFRYDRNMLFRRIGFESARPQTDFRACGLFGLFAVLYFSNYDPQLLLNGSYSSVVASAGDFKDFLANQQQCVYRYPLSVAIINVAHFVSNQLFDEDFDCFGLINCLINQYIEEMCNSQGVSREIEESESQLIISNNEYNYRQQREQCISNYDKIQFTNGEIALSPLKNMSGVHPALFGSVFLLISRLTILLDQRLSNYEGNEIYLNFNTQLKILETDFERVIKESDLGDINDLIIRMNE